jgi:hypothetical protein
MSRFIIAILITVSLSCTNNQSLPIYGEKCYRVDDGQKSIPVNDSIKHVYLDVLYSSDLAAEETPINRFYESKKLTTLAGVSTVADAQAIANHISKSREIIHERQDNTGYHFMMPLDSSQLIYTYIRDPQLQENTTALIIWNIAENSHLKELFENKSYYQDKFSCE